MTSEEIDFLLRSISGENRLIVADALEEMGRERESFLLRAGCPYRLCEDSNGRPVLMGRLTAQGENYAILDYISWSYPDMDVPDNFPENIRVMYRDEPDTGETWYRVYSDSTTHGDSEWVLLD